METKYVRVPFDLQLAKEITNGTEKGRIVTRGGESIRILCFDRKTDMYPIVSLVDVKNQESVEFHDLNGRWGDDGDDVLDLMLEIPEYMTFKDGDVIAYDNVKDVFFIIGSKCSMTDENPHYYVKYEKGYIAFGTEDSFCRLKGSRLATEEEKQRIIDALKESKDHKSYGCLKRFFGIEEKTEHEFKAGQPVIGIDGRGEWRYDLFSHYNPKYQNGNYVCSARSYSKCLPYNEQTAHLLGTTENYE